MHSTHAITTYTNHITASRRRPGYIPGRTAKLNYEGILRTKLDQILEPQVASKPLGCKDYDHYEKDRPENNQQQACLQQENRGGNRFQKNGGDGGYKQSVLKGVQKVPAKSLTSEF